MRVIRISVLVITLAAMLWVWPVHPFREVDSVRSGDEGHVQTEPMEIGESITQYFVARDNNIIQIEFVVSCDDRLLQAGEMLFELLDEEDSVIYTETLDYARMPDYGYGGPVVNVRVRMGRQYAYRLTNLSIEENMPCGVYTTDKTMCCLKKGMMEVGGQQTEGELLTRITTNRPLTAENTLAIWGCIGIVGFGLYEVLTRLEKLREEKMQ